MGSLEAYSILLGNGKKPRKSTQILEAVLFQLSACETDLSLICFLQAFVFCFAEGILLLMALLKDIGLHSLTLGPLADKAGLRARGSTVLGTPEGRG